MRKLLEIDFKDEIKKNLITVYVLAVLIFSVFIVTRTLEHSIFNLGFLFELVFVFGTLRFYLLSVMNRNYAFWGINIVISIYLLMFILHYTFFKYNIFVLYLSFLAGIFLAINAYMMSSPLYFPRIQWWEYDFRYRGELKAFLRHEDSNLPIRIADIRRECISFLAFEGIKLGEQIELEIPFGKKTFQIKGILKTSREDIPGRPIRYGLKVDVDDKDTLRIYNELSKVWNLKKKANIRRKFTDYVESKEANELQ